MALQTSALFGFGFLQTPERTLLVDFYAVGSDGAVLPDLTAGEVTIKIDGRTRVVRSLRLVRQADATAAGPLEGATTPAPFGTNNISEVGRSFFIVVDDESFRPGRERPVRSAVQAFLGALSARDRVSVWTVPHGGIKVDLTRNHDRVGEAMQTISGHGAEQESLSEAACRTRTTLEAIEHMLSTISGGQGPVNVFFFTGSLYGPQRDAKPNGPPGMCELTLDLFQRVGHSAAQARAHIYVIQPEDLVRPTRTASENMAGVGFSATMNPIEGIEHLAGATGGLKMSLTRLGDATLVTLSRATAAYYSAVVDAAASDAKGSHGLDVKVNRPGVDVRSRGLIFAAPVAGTTGPARTPSEMLRVGTVFSDLPLRVSSFASQNDPSGMMRVVAAGEPDEPGVSLTSLSLGFYDSQGKMMGQINLDKELSSMPAFGTMVLPAGTYRVRAAAVDSNGRAGTADSELIAEMTPAGPLKLSTLVLGLWRDNAFQPRLQFAAEPVAIAYLDVVGGSPGQAVGALVEVAKTLNGPALVTTRLALESTSDPSRFIASGAVPIASLPAGDYVVRAVVGVEGQAYGRVVRTLRKVTR